MKGFALLAVVALAGCGTFPRDPDATLERIRRDHVFRLGLIAAGEAGLGDARRDAFLTRVARSTGAAPAVIAGASEPLLLDLEAGRLDLVVGLVSPDSPWVGRVAMLRPLGESVAPQHLLLTPIARNGENRWIMLLEREARAVEAAT